MQNKRMLLAWLLAAGSAACSGDVVPVASPGPATNASPAQRTESTAVQASVSSALPAVSGAAQAHTSDARSKIYLDPATGLPRVPTAAELANEAAVRAQAQSLNKPTPPPVKVTPLPNGVTEYDLGDAAQVKETTCLHKDGSLGACSPAQIEELRAQAKQQVH